MISDFYSPFIGGVEVLVSSVSRELVARGHSVAVATLAGPDAPAQERDDGVAVYRIRTTAQRAGRLFTTSGRPWAPPVPDPEAVVGLRSVVERHRPDVVHGHDWLARSYLPLTRRGHRPAFVMSLHYYTLTCPKKNLMYRGSPCAGPGLAKCLGCAAGHYGAAKATVVVLGQRAFAHVEAAQVDLFLPVSAATAMGNGLAAASLPYEVIPNLVPAAPELHPSDKKLLDGLPAEPFLLFVGDVRRDKGVHVLLEAYALMTSPPPLLLVGEVWPDTPRRLPVGVSLLRDWPNAAVRAAMGRCLALVVPSLWPEPFGIVAAEALAAGRPVVASSIGGIPEIVRHRREGLLVAPGDPAALAAALGELCGEQQVVKRMVNGAVNRMVNCMATAALRRSHEYSPDVVVPMFEQAYQRALAGRCQN